MSLELGKRKLAETLTKSRIVSRAFASKLRHRFTSPGLFTGKFYTCTFWEIQKVYQNEIYCYINCESQTSYFCHVKKAHMNSVCPFCTLQSVTGSNSKFQSAPFPQSHLALATNVRITGIFIKCVFTERQALWTTVSALTAYDPPLLLIRSSDVLQFLCHCRSPTTANTYTGSIFSTRRPWSLD